LIHKVSNLLYGNFTHIHHACLHIHTVTCTRYTHLDTLTFTEFLIAGPENFVPSPTIHGKYPSPCVHTHTHAKCYIYFFCYIAAGKPVIVEHPVGSTHFVGDQVTLVCHAKGEPPLRYCWEFNKMSLFSERKPQLIIPQLTMDDNGWYQCTVSNKYGKVTSDACKLIVRNAQ